MKLKLEEQLEKVLEFVSKETSDYKISKDLIKVDEKGEVDLFGNYGEDFYYKVKTKYGTLEIEVDSITKKTNTNIVLVDYRYHPESEVWLEDENLKEVLEGDNNE